MRENEGTMHPTFRLLTTASMMVVLLACNWTGDGRTEEQASASVDHAGSGASPDDLGSESAGLMSTSRYGHSATLLDDGRILVSGGMDEAFNVLPSAEIFDSATGQWSRTGPMQHARSNHVAVLLLDGTVLVAGGVGSDYRVLASSELYDPVAGTWRETSPMAFYRGGHSALRLNDGRVIVTGGNGETRIGPSLSNDVMHSTRPLETAETFDPANEKWTTTKPMSEERSQHTSTLLSWGGVLVAGGSNGERTSVYSEIFDPASGDWTRVGAVKRRTFAHEAVLLDNGQVLLSGGFGFASAGVLTNKSEIFDPASNEWEAGGQALSGRMNHTLTTLADGRVLAVGGIGSAGAIDAVEYYHPDNVAWHGGPPLAHARSSHTATRLPDGRVVIIGGGGTTVEIFDPISNQWMFRDSGK